jgi:hypothetical protein
MGREFGTAAVAQRGIHWHMSELTDMFTEDERPDTMGIIRYDTRISI